MPEKIIPTTEMDEEGRQRPLTKSPEALSTRETSSQSLHSTILGSSLQVARNQEEIVLQEL